MHVSVPAAARGPTHADLRRALARRIAQAHGGLDDATLLSFVSGSVVEDLADALSDVDMSVVFETLPDEAVLRAACTRAGATPWFWRSGALADGAMVVAFHVDGIEVQVGYIAHAALQRDIDDLLLAHNPDTPNHKLAEGLLKAEPLVGAERLRALQRRLAEFPPGLAEAMLRFWLETPTPWRAITQLLQRDAGLWCRELLVEACWRQLGLLAGLNRRYFTRFQLKRLHKLSAAFAQAPPALADRIDALLQAPPREAFVALHALEGEVLALLAQHAPALDLTAAQARRSSFDPGPDTA